MVSLSSTPPCDVLLTKRNMHQNKYFSYDNTSGPHDVDYVATFDLKITQADEAKLTLSKVLKFCSNFGGTKYTVISVQIYCYICSKIMLYLYKDTLIFVQIYFYICANILLYLCRMQIIKKRGFGRPGHPSVLTQESHRSCHGPWCNHLIMIFIIIQLCYHNYYYYHNHTNFQAT